MQISPIQDDHGAWTLASSVLPHPYRPVVHQTTTGNLLVLRWYPAHKVNGPVVNVTGAGDSLVGSLLASVVDGQQRGGNPFHHPARLDAAIERAQAAAVLSLKSQYAVSPHLSS